MAKQRVFLASPPGADRAAFRAGVLERARALDAAPLAAVSVSLVDATPATPPWQRPGEAPAPAGPAFDAVLDLWGGAEALDGALRALRPALGGVPAASVRVAETVEKDALPRPAGRAAGVKFLSLMTFHEDLPPAAARRLWSHHAALALRVHVGMARYVRDWVVAEEPGGIPVPRFHGIAELHFPTERDMAERWFDGEAGRAAIVHDVGHFLLRATRLYATEHVLKAAS